MSSKSHSDPSDAPRDLSADAQAMKALAHPVRLRLLEELSLRGPLTATEASAFVNESPSTCSFHLRTLARFGFVESAEGGAGRRRPWRVVASGSRWESGPGTDPALRAAGETLAVQVRNRDDQLFTDFVRSQDELEPDWSDAVVQTSLSGWLTPSELAALGQALVDAWQPYLSRNRGTGKRPPNARPVHVIMRGFPITEAPLTPNQRRR